MAANHTNEERHQRKLVHVQAAWQQGAASSAPHPMRAPHGRTDGSDGPTAVKSLEVRCERTWTNLKNPATVVHAPSLALQHIQRRRREAQTCGRELFPAIA